MAWIHRDRWRRIRQRGLRAYVVTAASVGGLVGLLASVLLWPGQSPLDWLEGLMFVLGPPVAMAGLCGNSAVGVEVSAGDR